MQDLAVIVGHWSLFIGFDRRRRGPIAGSLLSVVGRGQAAYSEARNAP